MTRVVKSVWRVQASSLVLHVHNVRKGLPGIEVFFFKKMKENGLNLTAKCKSELAGGKFNLDR